MLGKSLADLASLPEGRRKLMILGGCAVRLTGRKMVASLVLGDSGHYQRVAGVLQEDPSFLRACFRQGCGLRASRNWERFPANLIGYEVQEELCPCGS